MKLAWPTHVGACIFFIMNPSSQIQLFGNFMLWLDGELGKRLHLSIQQQSLLAYLILHRDRAVTRQQIAFTFWPNTSEKQARTNLRQLLHHTRNAIDKFDRLVDVGKGTIHWRDAPALSCDLITFATLIAEAALTTLEEEKISLLTGAVEQYTGDLLSDSYADWLLPYREQYRQQFHTALTTLITLHSSTHSIDAAIACAQRLLSSDPLHEATYRMLMELYMRSGNRALAVRTYHDCTTLLQTELGVEPSAETVVCYERLLLDEAQRPITAPIHAADAKGLIGRLQEWNSLSAAWKRAIQGAAQLVVITGQAGVGKTRLAEELLLQVASQGFTAVRTRSYAAAGDLAYGPIAEWLRSPLLKQQWARLAMPRLREIARIVSELLVEQPHLPQPQPLTERWQRKQLFEALAHAFCAHAKPLLLLLDDLQWSDNDTVEFLHFLLRFQPTKPLLIVGTARLEEFHDHHTLDPLLRHLRADGLVHEIELGALTDDEVIALAKQMATDVLTAHEQQTICAMSAGNPFYVQEIVRSQGYLAPAIGQQLPWHRNDDALPLVIPPRIRAMIEDRLRTLSTEASELVAVAAIIGRAFPWELLAAVCNFSEEAMVAALDELWQRQLIREEVEHTYDFTHDLIRAVAYEMYSPPRRRHWHQRVVQALETRHAADLAPVSGQVGYHYEQMGEWQHAIRYYRQAAQFADMRYAAEQTAAYLKKVLSLLDKLPAAVANLQLRIGTLLEMVEALIGLQYTTAVEIKHLIEQAYELSSQLDDPRQQIEIMGKMFLYYGNRGDWFTCYKNGLEMLRLAEAIEENRYLCMAYSALSSVYLQQGNLAAALESYQHFFALYEVADLPAFSLITRRCRMAEALWLSGYPQQAHAMAVAAVQTADQNGQPSGRCFARDLVIYTLQHLDDQTTLRRLVDELAALCETYGFPTQMLTVQLFHGWLLVHEGAIQAGLAEMEASLVRAWDADNHFNLPYFLALLAHCYLHAGQLVDALSTLERAKQIGDAQGDWLWRAEIYRLLGDVHLHASQDADNAEALYRAALDTARQQDAKLLALRAATSLAHLWQSQGKHAEAHRLLAPLYGWFTEGFETSDLQKAQMLLDELVNELSLIR